MASAQGGDFRLTGSLVCAASTGQPAPNGRPHGDVSSRPGGWGGVGGWVGGAHHDATLRAAAAWVPLRAWALDSASARRRVSAFSARAPCRPPSAWQSRRRPWTCGRPSCAPTWCTALHGLWVGGWAGVGEVDAQAEVHCGGAPFPRRSFLFSAVHPRLLCPACLLASLSTRFLAFDRRGKGGSQRRLSLPHQQRRRCARLQRA